MATTRSSFSPLLRAASSHRTTTTSLHSHSSNPCHFSSTSRSVHTRAGTTLLRPHHQTYPNTFLHPQYPSNLHLFSTSRRVHTRAAAVQNPQTPSSIWPYAITFGCVAATGLTVFYKFQQNSVQDLNGSVNLEEMEFRFQWSFPSLFRKGHSVVVEFVIRPQRDDEIKDDNVIVKIEKMNCEFYLSATEVLANPEEITAAMERNKKIIAEKLKITKEEEQKVAEKEKLKVVEEEKEAAIDRYTTADPLKSKSKALSPKLVFTVTKPIKEILVMYRGIPDVLREGDSVFIKWFSKPITHEIKGEDKSAEFLKFYEVMQYKLGKIKEDKSAKSMTFKGRAAEHHYSVDVLAKNDEKYMPQDVAAVIIAE